MARYTFHLNLQLISHTLYLPSLPVQPKLQLGIHGERIAQCEHIKLVTTRSLPVQIDGGTWSCPYFYLSRY